MLNDKWTDVLAAEEYGLKRPAKSYPKRKLLTQFDNEAPNTYHHRAMRLTDHHVDGTKRQLKPNTSPPRHIAKAEVNQLTVIHVTFDMT